jgi:hypothetical protein
VRNTAHRRNKAIIEDAKISQRFLKNKLQMKGKSQKHDIQCFEL